MSMWVQSVCMYAMSEVVYWLCITEDTAQQEEERKKKEAEEKKRKQVLTMYLVLVLVLALVCMHNVWA
jgi:hypothetical protein